MNEERRLSLEELDAHTRVLLCELDHRSQLEAP